MGSHTGFRISRAREHAAVFAAKNVGTGGTKMKQEGRTHDELPPRSIKSDRISCRQGLARLGCGQWFVLFAVAVVGYGKCRGASSKHGPLLIRLYTPDSIARLCFASPIVRKTKNRPPVRTTPPTHTSATLDSKTKQAVALTALRAQHTTHKIFSIVPSSHRLFYCKLNHITICPRPPPAAYSREKSCGFQQLPRRGKH